MRITTVAGIKGGGTKSTNAQILATGIPYVMEKLAPETEPPRVLLFDHDPQATASAFNRVKDQTYKTMAHILNGSATPDEVIIKKGSRQAEVIIKKGNKEEMMIRQIPLVDTLPANQSSHQIDLMYPGTKYMEGVKALVKVLRESGLSYTHVIIDTPGTVGPIHLAQALTVSDDVILPVIPDTANFDVLDQTIDIVSDIKNQTNPNLEIDGLLITRATRTTISNDHSYAIQKAAELVGSRSYYATIRELNTIRDSQTYVYPVFDKIESKQTHEYIAFIAEYLGIFDASQSKEYLDYMYATLKD